MKKKKIVKILAASSLALFMGVGTLCGVLISPMNSAHANTSANASANLSAEEKLLGGYDLGLDPENDPVIFTTEGGIDIRFGAANLSSGALSGYTYVTIAGYNWVIIGRSTSGYGSAHTFASYHLNMINNSIMYDETSTPAGSAIYNDSNWFYRRYGGGFTISSKEVASSELLSGEVLCFSEKNIGNAAFDADSGYMGNYTSSDCELKTAVNNIYTTFPERYKKYIKQVTIKSTHEAYYDGIQQNSMATYLFPLATCYDGTTQLTATQYATQNFKIETYLTTAAKRISYDSGTTTASSYWLRSGRAGETKWYRYAHSVDATGSFVVTYTYKEFGVRPAFVLQISL